MSLLLDALKEAEARKREAAPAVNTTTAAPQVAATRASSTPVSAALAVDVLEASFESDGSLALAEDYVPPSAPAPGLPPGGRSGSSTPLAPPEPFHPDSSSTAAAAGSRSSASTAAPLTPAAADALLSSRGPRPASSPPAASATPVMPAPPATPTATTTPTSPAPTAAPPPRAVASPAARPAAASGAPGSPLRWLIVAAACLALLLAGLAVYDRSVDVPPSSPPALPPQPAAAAPFAVADPASLDAVPPNTSARELPADAARSRGAASADYVVRADAGARPPAGPRAEASPRRSASGDAPRGGSADDRGVPREASPTPPKQAVQISVSREPAPLEAAWAALQSGALARAETLYRGVLDSEPGQVDAQLGLAVIAQVRGDDAAARRGFARVLESVPDHPRAWAGLAELASEADAGTIESRLRQLLADRASAPLHFALGNLLARQQRWSDAQGEYFAAASLEPQAADYAFNVAVALERLDKPAAALPWYDKALAMAARGRAVRFDTAAVRARVSQLRAAPP